LKLQFANFRPERFGVSESLIQQNKDWNTGGSV